MSFLCSFSLPACLCTTEVTLSQGHPHLPSFSAFQYFPISLCSIKCHWPLALALSIQLPWCFPVLVFFQPSELLFLILLWFSSFHLLVSGTHKSFTFALLLPTPSPSHFSPCSLGHQWFHSLTIPTFPFMQFTFLICTSVSHFHLGIWTIPPTVISSPPNPCNGNIAQWKGHEFIHQKNVDLSSASATYQL